MSAQAPNACTSGRFAVDSLFLSVDNLQTKLSCDYVVHTLAVDNLSAADARLGWISVRVCAAPIQRCRFAPERCAHTLYPAITSAEAR